MNKEPKEHDSPALEQGGWELKMTHCWEAKQVLQEQEKTGWKREAGEK